ncbi:MAG TPA: hypothetical protein VGA36_08245, partial [Nitriliruptorales bacterium]
LGLGSSDTAPPADTIGGGDPGLPPPPAPEGAGERPVTKRCVGNPPRQTEDPLSPPCVAHFEGDNGGATHQGVTGDQIVVLMYADPVAYAPGPDEWPSWWDLGAPPEGEEPRRIVNMRAFQRYFNERYQLYGRDVRFIVHVSNITSSGENAAGDAATPENRAADAANDYATYEPFAVLTSQLVYGNEDVYIQHMVNRGVMSFGVRGTRERSIYQTAPGLIWSYFPTLDRQTDLFASLLCDRVIPHPVSYSGNGDDGQDRELGLVGTREESEPNRRRFRELTEQKVDACGGVWAERATTRNHGNILHGPEDDTEAIQSMSRFQQAGVTSVVVAQGYETALSAAAKNLDYYPEWVVAGDGFTDGEGGARWQDQDVWQHARVVTNITLIPEDEEQQPCHRAIREASPSHRDDYRGTACNADNTYNDLRQLFTGIQVAGPRLTPESIEQGFRAIPSHRSTDPSVPACFYEPGDYTCVKDATVEWWDPGNGQEGQANDGCWRMTGGGARFLEGAWPEGNVDDRESPDDPCNNFTGQAFL